MNERILILAPHTDDGELGCGGSIAKFISEGKTIHYVAFSVCEESVPEGLPKDTLEKELRAAAGVLGILPENLHIYHFPVRKLAEHRQEILEELVRLKRELSPDMVLMPSLHDVHQDHLTVAQEGVRAFKTCKLLCYEMVWNNLTFNTTAFIPFSENNIQKKLDALKMYHSQQGIRPYMSEDFVRSLASIRGVQIGCKYAEAFEVVRWIL